MGSQAGHAHQHVDFSEPGERLPHHPVDFLVSAYVDREGQCAHPRAFAFTGNALHVCGRPGHKHHVAAFTRERQGNGAAEVPAGASYQYGLPAETHTGVIGKGKTVDPVDGRAGEI